MRLLVFLARVFINGFGITQPTPEKERRAAWFIGALLLLTVLGAVGVFAAFLWPRHG